MTSEQTQKVESASVVHELSIPFTNRSVPGKITVTLARNTDAEHGRGFDLIFPSLANTAYPSQLFGFPTMKASIEYAGPSAPYASYAQFFGWIQFVKSTLVNDKGIDKDDEWNSGEWEMDLYPFAKDLKMPFVFWGHNPTAFDAPSRFKSDDGSFKEIVWRAHTFLCVLEDAGMSKKVQALKGTAFEWGFDIEKAERADGKGVDRKIVIKDAEVLDLETEWAGKLELLRREYPEWKFNDVPGN